MKPVKSTLTQPHLRLAEKHLSSEQLENLKKGNRKQLFRKMVLSMSQREPITKEKLATISKRAANHILGAKLAIDKGVRTTSTFFKTLPQSKRVQLQSGAIVSLRKNLGEPIFEFRHYFPQTFNDPESAIRVTIIPSEKEVRSSAFLKHKRGMDFDSSAKGSIGYIGCSINKNREGKPVLVVWTIQQRGIPSFPREVQRRYKNWHLTALREIENLARKQGVGESIVMTSPNITQETRLSNSAIKSNEMEYAQSHTNIASKYREYETQLAREGYSLGEINVELNKMDDFRKFCGNVALRKKL